MMWFRTVFDRLPRDWRERLLHVLIESTTVPDHAVKRGRQTIHLRELSYEELEETSSKTAVPDVDSARSGSADRGRPLLGS